MYRVLLIIVIIGLLVRLFILLKSGRLNSSDIFKNIKEDFSLPIKNLFNISSRDSRLFEVLRKLFYSLTAIFFVILGLTGFFPVLLFGSHLSGLLLIIHVTVAPLFVLSLMFAILFWANYQQYDVQDISTIKTIKKNKNSENDVNSFWEKTYFWLFSIVSLPAILSMILSMYPIFGTDGQVYMLNLHRYTVLFLLIIASFHIYNKYTKQLALDKSNQND